MADNCYMKPVDKSQYELMKLGKSYYIDSYLFSLQAKSAKTISKINSLPFGNKKREALFHKILASYGEGSLIKENFHCNYGFNIHIGKKCFINFNCTILDSTEVFIGDRVFIAPNVLICPVTHPLEAKTRRNLILGKIVIDDDVWIGAGTTILQGVTIHKGAVIGAHSLVKEDVAENTVVVGTPARTIKKIDNK